MVKENIHQSVEVIYKKVEEGTIENKQHTFFQMVYVISGSGFITLNGNHASYRSGSLLLLAPNDHHTFDISVMTEFLLIRFSSQYVKEYKWKSMDCLECLLYYAPHLSGCVMKSKEDMLLVNKMVESIL